MAAAAEGSAKVCSETLGLKIITSWARRTWDGILVGQLWYGGLGWSYKQRGLCRVQISTSWARRTWEGVMAASCGSSSGKTSHASATTARGCRTSMSSAQTTQRLSIVLLWYTKADQFNDVRAFYVSVSSEGRPCTTAWPGETIMRMGCVIECQCHTRLHALFRQRSLTAGAHCSLCSAVGPPHVLRLLMSNRI